MAGASGWRGDDIIAHGDRRVHHLPIDAAIAVTEAFHQRVRDREVADAGVGIDVGRRAAHDLLEDLEPRARADRDLLSDQIEFTPGRPAGDVEAAKAQRMESMADDAFDRSHRSEVDDRDHLCRRRRKS